jgi:HEAT repeat protein
MVRRFPLVATVSASVLLGLLSCRSSTEKARVELVSGTPAQQAEAAVKLTEHRDVQSIPELIALLNDSDPAVRMYAITALEDLTGKTYGYKFYAPEPERAAAIKRWQEALRQGELPTTPPAKT